MIATWLTVARNQASQNAPNSEKCVAYLTTTPKSVEWANSAIIHPPTVNNRNPITSAKAKAGIGQANFGLP